jgi:hypothetical protein
MLLLHERKMIRDDRLLAAALQTQRFGNAMHLSTFSLPTNDEQLSCFFPCITQRTAAPPLLKPLQDSLLKLCWAVKASFRSSSESGFVGSS